MDNAVEVDGLEKRYAETHALSEVCARFPSGRVIGLLGHNGAGKSTLIKLILGLIQPTAGAVRLFGASPRAANARRLRRRLAYLPENVAFYPNLSGKEVLDYCARLKGVSVGQGGELLRTVGLEAAAGRRVGTYSKGMRQRLGLAQMLIGDPELLVMDEPTTGLDPMAIIQFYRLIGELRGAGRTVIISSHLLAELEPHLDYAVVLDHGRVLDQGAIGDMRDGAALPVRIRARFADSAALQAANATATVGEVIASDGCVVTLAVPEARKVEALRYLTSAGGLLGIEVLEPSLPDLYARLAAPAAATVVD